MPCSGDSEQVCGGPLANSLYRVAAPNGDSAVAYEYMGCYADTNVSSRRMWRVLGTGPGGGNLDIPMDPPECAKRANASGYPYFAIGNREDEPTYGQICWGGELPGA
jgi:hypothetical protein